MADEPNNISKLLAVFVSPIQDIENTLQQLLIMRSVDTATGYQLDVLGKIVKQSRGGLDDDTYRRYIRARIAVHNSRGSVEDAIKVSDLIIYDDAAYYHVIQYGIAGYVVRIEDVIVTDLANSLILFLRPTAAGGVRVILETWPADSDDLFTLENDDPEVFGLGFGDDMEASYGGYLTDAID